MCAHARTNRDQDMTALPLGAVNTSVNKLTASEVLWGIGGAEREREREGREKEKFRSL